MSAEAKRLLGYEQLHRGQREAIEALLAGRDALVVMPTGSGKSAVYQLGGALLGGLTVVVSPLLALQRDQAGALAATDLGRVGVLSSELAPHQREQLLADVTGGEVAFLYAAPEQLQNADTLAALATAVPALVAVDEAHCVCTWGFDFRPDYLRLAAAVEVVGRPPVVALTATAAPLVRDEITTRLRLNDPLVVATGFDRPNIDLAVEHHHDGGAKDEAMLERVLATPGSGIVYAATRRRCDELAEAICERAPGCAASYHAGLARAARRHIEEAFSSGELRVVVATTAFGMGIDKPDVRFVFHADVPGSLDEYDQEIGRAGRDGEPAEARLYFRLEDLGLRRFFAAGHTPERGEVLAMIGALRSAARPVTGEELAGAAGLSSGRGRAALQALEHAGVAELLPGRVLLPPAARRAGELDAETVWERVAHEEAGRRRMDETRVEMMRAYAEARSCRRRQLLGYFGEQYEGDCGHCDNCRAGRALPPASEAGGAGRAPAFAAGSRVVHEQWGEGEVLHCEDGVVTALFTSAGYRTLAEEIVLERGLLRPAGADPGSAGAGPDAPCTAPETAPSRDP